MKTNIRKHTQKKSTSKNHATQQFLALCLNIRNTINNIMKIVRFRSKLFGIMIIILLLSTGLTIYALQKPFSGIIIKFENAPSNTKIQVQVDALLPPEDPNAPPAQKTILIAYANNNELRIPTDTIKDILQGIINYEQKYKNTPHITAANSLIISAWLLDENDNTIDTIIDTIPYNPQKLLNGGQEQKTIKFHTTQKTSPNKQPSEATCGATYYWETQQTWSTNTKIPTLIIYNDYPNYSATILGSVTIVAENTNGFRLGFSIKLPDYASFSSPQIGDFTNTGNYDYAYGFLVGPGQTGWSWIVGSVVGGYYKEVKYCTLTGAKSYTGREMVDVKVYPSVSGSYFVGGYEVRNDTDGSYYHSLLKYYEVGERGPLQIPNTPVADGLLNVNESLLFRDVAGYYAFSGFGVGVNAGKLLVVTLGLSTSNPIVAVLSLLAVTIQYVDYTTVSVHTYVMNKGAIPPEIPSPYRSYDASEMLYVGVSSYSVYFVSAGRYVNIPYQVIRSY